MLSTNKKNDETFTASKYSFQASNELIELGVTDRTRRDLLIEKKWVLENKKMHNPTSETE